MDVSNNTARLVATATTARLASLEAALQSALALTHAPVSSRQTQVDKVREATQVRQAVHAQPQPIPRAPSSSDTDTKAGETVLTHLSKTAGLIASLLSAADREEAPHARAGRAQPVLETPPRYPAELAIGLRDALERTGLFYESHLLAWHRGQLPRESLDHEPQMQLPRPQLEQASASTTASAATTASTPAAPAPGMEHEAARLVTQQLLLIDKPILQWSGPLWPGQPATVLIEQSPQPAADQPAAWNTRLHLDFPELGAIEINIRLDGAGINLNILGERHDSVSRMNETLPGCANRLVAAGCRVNGLHIGAFPAQIGETGHEPA